MKDKKKKSKGERLQKPASSVNFDVLDRAIVDNKLVATKDQTLVFRRARGYEMITLVKVLRIYDDGSITLWDETLGQNFILNVNDVSFHDRLRIYDKSRIGESVFHQEIEDDVPMNSESNVGTSLDDE